MTNYISQVWDLPTGKLQLIFRSEEPIPADTVRRLGAVVRSIENFIEQETPIPEWERALLTPDPVVVDLPDGPPIQWGHDS